VVVVLPAGAVVVVLPARAVVVVVVVTARGPDFIEVA
jgi:hypothetical protein